MAIQGQSLIVVPIPEGWFNIELSYEDNMINFSGKKGSNDLRHICSIEQSRSNWQFYSILGTGYDEAGKPYLILQIQ